MTKTSIDSTAIIIGAGITGIGAAYYLRESGIPYVVLEANSDVGGVWHTQRWHGARCDSDFIKYCFSFKPYLSPHCLQDRAEIQRYLRSVTEEFAIIDHIRFDTKVTAASFDSRTQRWVVETSGDTFTAQFVINGNGYFSAPHVPKFPGVDEFRGEVIHTFNLDASRSFEGKDVVLVGSGSTAGCAAPELAKVSKSLTMLQRSPSYVYEIDNHATFTMRVAQALYRKGITLPLRLLRGWLQARDDIIFVGFRAEVDFPPTLARRRRRGHAARALHAKVQPLGAAHPNRRWLQGGGPHRQGGPEDCRDRALHRLGHPSEERRGAEVRRLHSCHGLRAELPQVSRAGGRRRGGPGRHQFLQGPDDGRGAELLPAGRCVALGVDAALGNGDALRREGHPPHAAERPP